MKFARSGAAVSLLAAGTLVLTACGGGTNSSSSGAGGTFVGALRRQEGAHPAARPHKKMPWSSSSMPTCDRARATLDYNANGSGAGVTQFLNNETDFAGSDVPLNPSTGQPDRAAERCGSRHGPADGVRPDRDHLQYQGREHAES